jgi:hypothetical protein
VCGLESCSAVTNAVHLAPHVAPRLLDDRAAAAYLSLPVAALKRLRQGRVIIDGRTRWDRFALDAWLDEQRGVVAPSAAGRRPANQDDAEAALDRWTANKAHAARPA